MRITTGPMRSDDSYGNNGAFTWINKNGVKFKAIASDGGGWEHVSVQMIPQAGRKQRIPTWTEMCIAKDLFWDHEDCVVQFHPPETEYVNVHNHVLHLWRKIGYEMPLPYKIMI